MMAMHAAFSPPLLVVIALLAAVAGGALWQANLWRFLAGFYWSRSLSGDERSYPSLAHGTRLIPRIP